MACLHARFILLFVPFLTPLFAVMLARWVPGYKQAIDKYAINAILMTTAVLAMVQYRPTEKSLEATAHSIFPVDAAQYLRDHPVEGRLFNTYATGGYLMFSEIPTFIDGRGDVFERGGAFADYAHV